MERTYFFFVHAHQPVTHVIHHIDPLDDILALVRLVSVVDARDPLVFPPLTKGVFVVQQAELLNNIVHYEVDIDYRLTPNVLLVGIAQLAHHVNGKSLVWIELQHALYDASQLRRVLLTHRWELALRDTLEEIIQ